MSVPLVLSLIAAAGAAAISAGRQLTRAGRARHQLRRRPVLGPASAEGDHVRVTGVVRLFDRTLTAPLSERTCVAYWTRASIRLSTGRGGAPMASKPESVVLVPFLIDRGADGVVLVNGTHALFDVPPVKLTPEDTGARGTWFLALHGLTSQHGVTAGFREVVIEVGMTITVVGVVLKDVALEPPTEEERTFRDAPAPTVQLTGNRKHPLVFGRSSK